MKNLAIALGLGVLIATTAPAARAATISPAGDSFTVNFKGTTANVNEGPFLDWLTSSITFHVLPWSGDTITVELDVANTTSGIGNTSVLTSFGFNVDPNVLQAGSTASGVFGNLLFSQDVNAHGLKAYVGTPDLCVAPDTSCQAQGPQGGLAAGQSGQVTLTLKFSGVPETLSLDNFFVRYQAISFNGVNLGSGAGIPCTQDDEICTPPCQGNDCPGDTVPEPTTLALLGVALLGAGFARKRR